jgi:hypothetical protein
MKKVVVIALLFVAGAVFGQEDIFKHIDFFIQNFPQSNQEARDKLVSWGYMLDEEMLKAMAYQDNQKMYIIKDYLYQLRVWPRINSLGSNGIGFSYEFYLPESVAFYQTYRAAVNYFTEKYNDFSKTIENNNHIFTKGDIRFSISYRDTQHLTIGIIKKRSR